VTVPVPAPLAVADTLLPTTENVTEAELTKFTLGIAVPLMFTEEEPEPTAASIKTKSSAIIGSIPLRLKPKFGVIGSELCK
jgi:hypothetical protein